MSTIDNEPTSVTGEHEPPLLIRLGHWVTMFALLVGVAGLALAPWDVVDYSIGNESVSGTEFLRGVGVPYTVLLAVLTAVAVGLQQQRRWVRGAMLAAWVAAAYYAADDAIVGGLGRPEIISRVAGCLVAGAIAAWYLYRKSDVAAWFRSLA